MNEFVEPLDESLLTRIKRMNSSKIRKKDIKAFQIIQQGLDDTILARIKGATTAKQA